MTASIPRAASHFIAFTAISLGILPTPSSAQPAGARFPQLTKQDIAPCRNEFAAVQADVVQHFRIFAAQDGPSWTGAANEAAAKDPITFYYEGMLSDGQGVGDIPTMNGFDGPTAYGLYQQRLTRQPQQDGPDALSWSLVRDQVAAAADQCVARIYFNKFDEMNPQIADAGSSGNSPSDRSDGNAGSAPASPSQPGPTSSDNMWGTCVSTEGPEPSGIQMIYYLRNRCNKAITVSFCMKATYEAAGDWNLCSQREYKTFDIRAGDRLEFPFTPLEPGDTLTDGRVVDHNEVSASGAACVGSSPSVYIENKDLVFQHC